DDGEHRPAARQDDRLQGEIIAPGGRRLRAADRFVQRSRGGIESLQIFRRLDAAQFLEPFRVAFRQIPYESLEFPAGPISLAQHDRLLSEDPNLEHSTGCLTG